MYHFSSIYFFSYQFLGYLHPYVHMYTFMWIFYGIETLENQEHTVCLHAVKWKRGKDTILITLLSFDFLKFPIVKLQFHIYKLSFFIWLTYKWNCWQIGMRNGTRNEQKWNYKNYSQDHLLITYRIWLLTSERVTMFSFGVSNMLKPERNPWWNIFIKKKLRGKWQRILKWENNPWSNTPNNKWKLLFPFRVLGSFIISLVSPPLQPFPYMQCRLPFPWWLEV